MFRKIHEICELQETPRFSNCCLGTANVTGCQPVRKNCVVCSLFSIFTIIIIVIVAINISFVALLNFLSQPMNFPFCPFLLTSLLWGEGEGRVSGCQVLVASCCLKR